MIEIFGADTGDVWDVKREQFDNLLDRLAARLRLRVAVRKRESRILIWMVRASKPSERNRPATDSTCRCSSAVSSLGLLIS